MKLLTHYLRLPPPAARLAPDRGPLRSLLLQQIPRDRLAVEGDIIDGVVAYLDRHPGERVELLSDMHGERVRPACEQLLAELVLDGFVLEIPGRVLYRLVAGGHG